MNVCLQSCNPSGLLCSASLFYIAKGEDKNSLSVRVRQKMIVVLLDAMETHLSDSTMMRNGCLTLCQFRIPQDVVCIAYCLKIKGKVYR